MPDGALLVNVARGKVVDTDALVEATATGRMHGGPGRHRPRAAARRPPALALPGGAHHPARRRRHERVHAAGRCAWCATSSPRSSPASRCATWSTEAERVRHRLRRQRCGLSVPGARLQPWRSTVVAMGTRKGLWLARSEDRQRLVGGGPAVPHARGAQPGLRCPGRRASGCWPGSGPSTGGRRCMHSDDLGATWHGARPRARRSASPTTPGPRSARIWQITADPHDREVVWAGTRAARAVAQRRRRDVVRAGAWALGPPAPAAVGRGLRRRRHPHGPARPAGPRPRARGDEHRRGLHHRGRRCDVGGRATRASRPLRARPVPGVRPVRPQGRP